MYEELAKWLRNCASSTWVEDCDGCPYIRYDGTFCLNGILTHAADAIEELQEQRGEWIRCGDGENVPYQCSHCGKTVPAILVENWAGVKYCPMCGAKVEASNG